MSKEYLGDGVYVELEGREVILTTEVGLHTTNTIVLEPAVLENLWKWLNYIRGAGKVDPPARHGG